MAPPQITSSGPKSFSRPWREHLALLAQVAGEEDDQHDLRELAGLELERADCDPEARAVDLVADPGQRGQEEQHDRAEPEEVLVALEPPVVVAQQEQRGREEADADHDPQPLAERVVRVEPVDLGQPIAASSGHRQQVRIGHAAR